MRTHSHPDTSKLPVCFCLCFFFLLCASSVRHSNFFFFAVFAKCVFGGDRKLILIHGIPFQQATGIALKPFCFSSKRLPSVLLIASCDIKRIFHDASAVVSLWQQQYRLQHLTLFMEHFFQNCAAPGNLFTPCVMFWALRYTWKHVATCLPVPVGVTSQVTVRHRKKCTFGS